MPRLPILIALSLFLFSAFLLACGSSAAPAEPSAPPTATPAPTPTPVPIQVSALELYQEWDSNQVAAEAKYKDQWVLVTGKISNIAEAGSGYDVKLRTEDFSLTEIVCKVDASQVDTVLALQEGQYIAIHGVLEGQGFVDIVVQNCAVQDVQESIAAAEPQAPTAPPEPNPTDTPDLTPAPTGAPEPAATREPTPTTEPTPTPEPTATPEPTPLPPGSAVDNPVPSGSVLKGADGTEVVVTGIVDDAWELIQAGNKFADPPQEGNRYYLISLSAAYVLGNGSVEVAYNDFSLVGDHRIVYSPFFDGCSGIPARLESELYLGGKSQGNICFEVPADESAFILIHQPEYGAPQRFLSLDPLQVGSFSDLTEAVVEPDPAALAMPAGMTLDNPVEIGGAMPGVNGSEVVVAGIVSDAWSLIQEESPSADPPQEGNRYYLITVGFSYVSGAETLEVDRFDFRLVGSNRLVYHPYEADCSGTPDRIEGELFPGGQTQGNICFEVPQSETGFILIYQPEAIEVASRSFLRLE